jgi:hypothetical protein
VTISYGRDAVERSLNSRTVIGAKLPDGLTNKFDVVFADYNVEPAFDSSPVPGLCGATIVQNNFYERCQVFSAFQSLSDDRWKHIEELNESINMK